MTGINPTTPSLLQQGLDGLKKGIREGTLQPVRGQLLNASPERLAKAEAAYQDSVRSDAQQKADYRSALSRTTFDTASSSAALPDVASLSKTEAKSMLSGLRQMDFVGDLDGKTLNASNGDNSTGDVKVYMQWLQARVGIDTFA